MAGKKTALMSFAIALAGIATGAAYYFLVLKQSKKKTHSKRPSEVEADKHKGSGGDDGTSGPGAFAEDMLEVSETVVGKNLETSTVSGTAFAADPADDEVKPLDGYDDQSWFVVDASKEPSLLCTFGKESGDDDPGFENEQTGDRDKTPGDSTPATVPDCLAAPPGRKLEVQEEVFATQTDKTLQNPAAQTFIDEKVELQETTKSYGSSPAAPSDVIITNNNANDNHNSPNDNDNEGIAAESDTFDSDRPYISPHPDTVVGNVAIVDPISDSVDADLLVAAHLIEASQVSIEDNEPTFKDGEALELSPPKTGGGAPLPIQNPLPEESTFVEEDGSSSSILAIAKIDEKDEELNPSTVVSRLPAAETPCPEPFRASPRPEVNGELATSGGSEVALLPHNDPLPARPKTQPSGDCWTMPEKRAAASEPAETENVSIRSSGQVMAIQADKSLMQVTPSADLEDRLAAPAEAVGAQPDEDLAGVFGKVSMSDLDQKDRDAPEEELVCNDSIDLKVSNEDDDGQRGQHRAEKIRNDVSDGDEDQQGGSSSSSSLKETENGDEVPIGGKGSKKNRKRPRGNKVQS